MCGIAGILGSSEQTGRVREMTEALAHRGPDDQGYFIEQGAGRGIALGHRRLAILDLSPAGRQPMASRDGRYVLVLNGEIFNYRELGQELSGPFRSASDTEVLVEACAAWGLEKTLEKANGMFAFALWDTHRRELSLARDRCGEKPLVYFSDGTTFAFASEMKALQGWHGSRLDPEAVDAYLALGYVPAPLGIFRDCRKLPAGHLLRVRDRAPGIAEIRRWWVPERAIPAAGRSRRDRIEELRALLADAVRIRLRADVPLALCLSGGVDSTVVAAECARQGAALNVFTVALDGDATDLPYARMAAAALDLKHEIIEAPQSAAGHQLQSVVEHYDEPFADSSALPALALARALGGRYKIVLNGDGGDEAFAGYRHYEHIAAKQIVKAVAAAAGIAEGSGGVGVYVQSKSTFRSAERVRMLGGRASGDTLSLLLSNDEYLGRGNHLPAEALRRALWSDRHLYLPNDLTYKMDIALGAFGMEGRAPFLDHRILEWSQGLEDCELVRGREKKILLREAYRRELPAGILDRPKHGFGAPISAWLAGPLEQMCRESLPCPLLDASAQAAALGDSGGQRQWTLLAFACWARTWRATW